MLKARFHFGNKYTDIPAFYKDKQPIEETAANDTNKLFNPLFAENYNKRSSLIF